MDQYKELCRRVLDEGVYKKDRTGVGTYSITGVEMRFDLSKGFPLLTTKRVPFRLVLSELLWFIRGDTNIRYLLENNNNIWNEWPFKRWVESADYKLEGKPDMADFGLRANDDSDFKKVYLEIMEEFKTRILEDDEFAEKWGGCGPIYGKQWRDWIKYELDSKGDVVVGSVDQLKEAIDLLKYDPYSRRIVINSWNVSELEEMSLNPCHYVLQFVVREGKLDCVYNMRSNDVFLGKPLNIASYALLTHMVAQVTGLGVGELIYHGADVHIYSNHLEQVRELLTREPKKLPELVLNKEIDCIDDFDIEDVSLIGYDPHPTIKASVAV